MIKAVVFDMDGVLIDSEIEYLRATVEVLSKKYPWITSESLFPTVGMSWSDYPAFMANLMHRDINDPQFIKDLHEGYGNPIKNYHNIMREEVPTLLESLKQMGFRIALASSSPIDNIKQVLADCKITDYFELIVSGHDFKRSKPEPDIYLYTFEKLGIQPEEAIIIEDSTYGVQSGKAAGGNVIALKDNRFNFDQSLADYHIDNLSEVVGIVGKKFKAVFFDVDGTLTDMATHELPEENKIALQALRNQGIKIIVSTGRAKSELIEGHILEGEYFDGYIFMNGQLTTFNDQIIDEHRYSKKQLASLKQFLEEFKAACIFYDNETATCNFVNDEMIKLQAKIGCEIPEIRDMSDFENIKLYQAVPYITQEQEELFKERIGNVKLARWGECIADAMTIDGGKDSGVRKVCEYLGIDSAETIAFGDGENDIPMLMECGLGIAMANGEDIVKQAADYVTDRYDCDGIAKALKKFGVID